MNDLDKKHNVGIHDLRKLTEAILNKYGVDFGHYAMSSLQRRIVRILLVYKLNSIQELIIKFIQIRVFLMNL